MRESLEASLVRIHTADGHVVGAGFLVGERHILTCAQVVDSALGLADDAQEKPKAHIMLDVPHVARGKLLTARVVLWRPQLPDGGDDIAGLELLDNPPHGAQAAPLAQVEDLWEHRFLAFGFPAGYDDGVWATGRLLGRQSTNWVQIEDVKVTGFSVGPGFSGTPIWDSQVEAVVGMIVVNRKETSKIAFAIPVDVLINAWPSIETISPPTALLTSNLRTTFLNTRPKTIEFSIQQGDITSFEADVVALKYAQKFYGADGIIARLLNRSGVGIERLRPHVGDYCYVDTKTSIQAHHALFVGVPEIRDLDYQNIQEFSSKVLTVLANEDPNTKHLVMTMHGVGFGLDEIEAFLAQFAGYLEAMEREQVPPNLEYITVIDINVDRVNRLRHALEEYLSHADFAYQVKTRWAYRLDKQQLKNNFKKNRGSTGAIERVGIESDAKPLVFVAMPFRKDMDDVFYYGIQQPVRSAGLLCERVDQEAFIGDILDQVKKKIETAAVVIAELSGANPNVYLEVGYAWGKGRPTILLIKDDQELRFDVRGQRCLKYQKIKELEESLKKELKELKSRGFI